MWRCQAESHPLCCPRGETARQQGCKEVSICSFSLAGAARAARAAHEELLLPHLNHPAARGAEGKAQLRLRGRRNDKRRELGRRRCADLQEDGSSYIEKVWKPHQDRQHSTGIHRPRSRAEARGRGEPRLQHECLQARSYSTSAPSEGKAAHGAVLRRLSASRFVSQLYGRVPQPCSPGRARPPAAAAPASALPAGCAAFSLSLI